MRPEDRTGGVELTTCNSEFTLELLDASPKECELPILRGDDHIEAGVRPDTDLARLSCSYLPLLAQLVNPLPQLNVVGQVGLTDVREIPRC